MNYKPKFDIGQTVYEIETGDVICINCINAYFDEVDNQIHYFYGTGYGDYNYNEELLTAGKPPYKPKPLANLKNGDSFYVVTFDGNYKLIRYDEDSDDNYMAFATASDAEQEIKRRKIQQRLNDLAGNYRFTLYKSNYYIAYRDCYDFGKIDVAIASSVYLPNVVYFKSYDDAIAAINEIGADVLMHDYFGIEV